MAASKKPQSVQVTDGPERRAVLEPLEIREADDVATIRGYAAVFNAETVIWGLFREQIAPGAFRDALKSSDTVALFNHDPNYPLARESNDTLRLSEDKRGLKYEADLDLTDPDAQKVRSKIERGTVKGSSFGFTVEEDEWDESEMKQGKMPLRTITRIGELYDVSPVTFPAYPQTSVSARSKEKALALMAAAGVQPAVPSVSADVTEREAARTAITAARAWVPQP